MSAEVMKCSNCGAGLSFGPTATTATCPYCNTQHTRPMHSTSIIQQAEESRFGIPVIYTSRYRPLAEEKAASWLSKHFTYWYLEKNGFGRVLQEGDL
jgi:predicted RNA-binding Zn-ribbon protein involved in translation (DUF1610 family)